jgi:hypothetical protein
MEIPTIFELSDKLKKSEAFLKFKSEYPDAFFCAGFFILNFKSGVFDYSLDYRNDKQIFSFKIPLGESKNIVLETSDIFEKQTPLPEISCDVQVDIEQLKEIVEENLAKNNIKNKLEELIAVLQMIDGNKVWNLTCMCEGFTIISCQIHSETAGILKFEKKNLLDFVKKP